VRSESEKEGDAPNPPDNRADLPWEHNALEALHRLIQRRVGNSEDAQDVLQKALLAFLGVPDPDQIRSPVSYLARIALRLAAKHRAQQQSEIVKFDSESADNAGEQLNAATGDVAETLSNADHLEAVLRKIPDTYRDILVMHLGDGMSHQEIADRLSMPLSTVRTYVARGKAHAARVQKELMQFRPVKPRNPI
jgi:RNA polymerase sigma factor (sigma-70 family)